MQADDQQEALLAAASAGDVAHARVLLEARADPNAAPTSGGGTPLELAALEGHQDMVRTLLSHRADPNVCDADGWTPLHNAMLVSSVEGLGIVRALVAARADVNARTLTEGHAPLHMAHEGDPKVDWKLVSGADVTGRTAFYSPAVVQTLVGANADVDASSSSGATPLHEASAVGASSCVLALLHSGARVGALDAEGATALQLAGTRSVLRTETIERLREMLRAASAPPPPGDGPPRNGPHVAAPIAEAPGCQQGPGAAGAPEAAHACSLHDTAPDVGIESPSAEGAAWAAALEAVSHRLRGLRSVHDGAPDAAAGLARERPVGGTGAGLPKEKDVVDKDETPSPPPGLPSRMTPSLKRRRLHPAT